MRVKFVVAIHILTTIFVDPYIVAHWSSQLNSTYKCTYKFHLISARLGFLKHFLFLSQGFSGSETGGREKHERKFKNFTVPLVLF